jgi:hypothetical protein
MSALKTLCRPLKWFFRGGIVRSLLGLVLALVIYVLFRFEQDFIIGGSVLLRSSWDAVASISGKLLSALVWLLPHERGSVAAYGSLYFISLVMLYAAYKGRKRMTVISPFHLPREGQFPFGEYTVANALGDAFLAIETRTAKGLRVLAGELTGIGTGEAGTGLTLPGFMPPELGFEVPARFAVEVKGLSYEALISIARKVWGTERIITGDMLIGGGRFVLFARGRREGPWRSGCYPVTPEGLEAATQELALTILGEVYPTYLAAHLIAERRFQEAYERLLQLVHDEPK